MNAANAGSRDGGLEHAFELIARPHRALAVIGVIEQSRLGRPGEHHRLTAEFDAVGEMRGIERRGLECLFETVHVDQDVASAPLREKIADLSRHRLDPVKAPIAQTGRGERETVLVGRHQLRPADGHPCSALRPEPGFRPSAVYRLARGCDEQRRLSRERRRVVTRARRAQAGASTEREHAGRRHNPAQQRAPGRKSLVLQQMSERSHRTFGNTAFADPPPQVSPTRMARKGRATAINVPVPSRFRDPAAGQRNHFNSSRSPPETKAPYVVIQSNDGVRSCWYQCLTSSTASSSSVPFPAWHSREESYDRDRDGIPSLRQHRRIPCPRI